MTDEQTKRFDAFEAKMKQAKAAKDSAKSKDLAKLTKAELIALVNGLKA